MATNWIGLGNERIAVANVSAPFRNLVDQLKARRFARIRNIGLVGKPHNQHL